MALIVNGGSLAHVASSQPRLASPTRSALRPENELPDYVVQGTAEYHTERARQAFKKPASKLGRTIGRPPDDGQPTDPEQLSNAELDRIAESLDDKQGREAVIVKLAAMSPLEYDEQRTAAAKVLGVRASTLDASVKAKRADGVADTTALPHWDVSAWPEPVDGAQLLDGLGGMFRRYVVLPVYAPDALALWIMHAWAFEAWEISPFIVLVSPEKRCGKTTVLIILQFLAPKTELASNISNAAMFRYIEDERPTLLIDEADSFLKDNEEMRGVLNSGHTKQDTLEDRAIMVAMISIFPSFAI